ncbi:hypothetical protein Tco_0636815, partial [Tanacetum coccineum]
MVYVDDIIFGSTNKELCTGFEKLMKDKFQMSSMGELTFFLGLQSALIPVDLEKPLVKDEDADDVDVHLYRSMIGSLMYLSASRKDIMFAVCACARFQVTPKTSHLLTVKRIFRYLKGKPTLGLWYSRDSPFELVAYTDSDYAGATQDRKSTTGGFAVDKYSGYKTDCWIIESNTSKEVRTPRYLSLVVPLKKVGDEAVHKELGDRMERAATTASSLEAEQDSGSGPRCQDTILGDVDAQTRFEITSKQSNDPPLSRGYTLRSGEDSMKLLELMELCTQLSYKNRKSVLFLLLVYINAAKLMLMLLGSVNAVRHMLMLPVQVPAAEVFINQQLGDMSHHKKIFVNPSHTKKVFANMKRAGKDFSRRITPLFDTMMVQASEEVGEDSDHPTDSNQIPIVDQPSTSSQPKQKQKSKRRQRKEAEVAHDETEHEESVPTPSNDPLPSGEDSMQLNDLMVLCTKLQTQVLDLEKAKDAQAKEIADLKKRVQRLERKKKSRTT